MILPAPTGPSSPALEKDSWSLFRVEMDLGTPIWRR